MERRYPDVIPMVAYEDGPGALTHGEMETGEGLIHLLACSQDSRWRLGPR